MTGGWHFFQTPHFVQDLGLSGNELRLYLAIGRSANNRTRLADVSRETLAERCACTVRAVEVWTQQLEEAGAMFVVRRPGKRNLYWLPRSPQDEQLELPGANGDSPQGRTHLHPVLDVLLDELHAVSQTSM